MDSIYAALDKISGQDVFLHTDKEILDFTHKYTQPIKIYFSTKTLTVETTLPSESKALKEFFSLLQIAFKKNTILFGWNIKDIYSYALGTTGAPLTLDCNIFDLALLEPFVGITNPRPTSFQNCVTRLMHLKKETDWDNLIKIYKNVYLPLSIKIPTIETFGFVDKEKKQLVYSHYKIAGHVNGRMKTNSCFDRSFTPHILTMQDKSKLKLPNSDLRYLYLDYKNMEVTVLAWLSQDNFLMEMMNNGKDVYWQIWEAITGMACTDVLREKCKDVFLPIIYGSGSEGLAAALGVPLSVAERLVDNTYKTFPELFAWMRKHQGKSAKDYFGRIREVDSSYKTRNFLVASPAALVCMHKLARLMDAIKDAGRVCMHIHDAYIIACHRDNVRKVTDIAKEILQSEEELYPGLKLRVACKTGEMLDHMVSCS